MPARSEWIAALAALTLVGAGCHDAPTSPAGVGAPAVAPPGLPPRPQAPLPAPSPLAAPLAPPTPPAPERDRRLEVPVECNGMTLYGLAPRAWVRDEAGAGCAARWTVPAQAGAGVWVTLHCLPSARVGLPELEAWHEPFRQADGTPMPVGGASLGSTCDWRQLGIRVQGTLAAPIACLPLVPPVADLAYRRTVLETPRALFAFDLAGPPAALEREISESSDNRSWRSSILADYVAFVSSMRERAQPAETSAYRRACP